MILVGLVGYAEKITRIDGFSDGESKFGFDEMSDKKTSVSFDGEYMILSSKQDLFTVGTRFPVLSRENFTISYKILCPVFDKKHRFGLVFNYQEDDSMGDILVFSENEYFFASGVLLSGNQGADIQGINAQKVKLKSGKNVNIDVKIEKRGSKTLLSINGMDYELPELSFQNSYMGFSILGKNSTLKVDEIFIEQTLDEE